MRRWKQWAIAALSFMTMLVVGLGIAVTPNVVPAEAAVKYSTKAYKPTVLEEFDPYVAMGNIDVADGGGVTTFAHSGLTTPLEGANISLDTSFTLLPKTTEDGWLTYSFTSSPVTADSQIPNYDANAQGIFFHITNYSSTSAPNSVEVQFVQNNGSNVAVASSLFLDNAVGVAINFSLAKQSDGTYTWTVTRLSDNVVLKTVTGLAFTESLFVNENGQTYFSTALYGSENGNAAANRGVNVYTVQKYALDIFSRGYIPTTAHEFDPYGAMKNIAEGGVTTFAHSGLSLPLEGANISLDTSFTLLPKTTEDGWLTYSFTSSPVTADSQIPNYGANGQGIFFHITNYSSTSAPNCVEVQFVQNNGSNVAVASSLFLDNAVGVAINFSLAKQSDGTYTWTITRLSDNVVLKTVTGLAFTESLFVNENGQTYFSTALYGSENGDKAANRAVSVYSMEVYDGELTTAAYAPDMWDTVDMFHTTGVYKGDLSYYGHTALKTPLDGENISVTSTFSLLSAKATSEGGDGIDGWVTYSFSSTLPTQESEIPHASGTTATGLYFQFTNVSGSSAANCAQMYVGYKINGVSSELIGSAFVDNIIGYNWTISLKKIATNTFDVAIINNETGVTAWSYASAPLNEAYFVNENGQTYFSSAMYGSQKGDVAKGNRYVYLHSVGARTYYAPEIEMTMEAEEFVYTYGSKYEPVQSVSLNGTTLAEGTDYTLTYVDNDVPGTATIRLGFLGKYYGLPEYIETFEIKEASSGVAELQALIDTLQDSFKMHEGAAVKLSNPTGLRFGTDLSVDALNALKNYAGVTNVTAGTIILPYEYLGVGELPRLDSGRSADAAEVKDRILIIPCTVLSNAGFAGTFYGAITGIKEANSNRQFSARAYISYTYDGTTYTIYAAMDDNVRSVNYVSYSALLDESKDYGTDGDAILQNFVDIAQKNYGDDIQYVTYMLTNKNVDEIEPYIQRMVAIHGENDPASGRMYAFGVPGPFLLSQSVAQMKAMVEKCFDLAAQYNVPVFFQIDDMTNYINFSTYATEQFGGDALVKFWQHPEMCEWVQFPTEGEEYGGQNDYGRLPRWYFNWGTEASTAACPNLASPEFKELIKYQLQEGFLKPLAAKMKELTAENKGYLFAGCNIGWETQIPDYSEDSYLCPPSAKNIVTLEDWEQTEYGYAALHTLGYTAESLAAAATENGVSVDEQRKNILYGVMQDFIEFIAKLVYDAGVPRDLIYTHTIANGTKSGTYDTMMPPIWVAINDYSTPGYTMANANWDQTTLENTLAENGASTYIIAEGYKSGYDGSVAAAKAYFEQQFGGNCRNITVFGYDEEDTTDTSADYFEQAVNQWLAKQIVTE